jgi:hypothetical protein
MGYTMRKDYSATEKQALDWNPKDNIKEEGREEAGQER